MAYTPDPTDSSQPVSGVKASTAAAEFRALKQYIAALAGLTPITSISALTVQQLNGGQLAGLRNRVINGGCQVQQGVTATLSTSPQYGNVDGYLVSTTCTGISGNVREISTSEFLATSVGVGVLGSWTTGAPQIEQRIEAKSTIDLNGKTVTISGRLFHTLGSTRSVRVQLNRPTTTADVFSAQAVLGSSDVFSCPDSVATAFSFTIALGATDAEKGLAIQVFDTATSTVVSKIFAISELQLETGTVATPFEMRPAGLELALCQRYYEVAATVGNYASVVCSCYNAADAYCQIQFKVQKRASAAVTISAFGNWSFYSGGSQRTINAIQTQNPSDTTFQVKISSANTFTSGQAAHLDFNPAITAANGGGWTSSAEL